MAKEIFSVNNSKQTNNIYGLVLTGGKSSRMGENKALIEYHDSPHFLYLADLLNVYCDNVFISISSLAENTLKTHYEFIEDKSEYKGPIAGIMSAMNKHPEAAWLVVACDLPCVNESTIYRLIEKRDDTKIATAYYNPETEFPEPLITLWEKGSLNRINEFIAQDYTCPRKVLINSDINLISSLDTKELMNANDPEVRERALNELKRNS